MRVWPYLLYQISLDKMRVFPFLSDSSDKKVIVPIPFRFVWLGIGSLSVQLRQLSLVEGEGQL